ncbi:hypothetical protein [Microbulbifer sp. ALW1]|uniref:hypothetical protein n=1 Tax=Microbulbifer sp. (strain ALW1) TaxID=1516059 RepID=UPI001913D19E|nr:hypothetical protein [Microbulbifer sp. ALW1]
MNVTVNEVHVKRENDAFIVSFEFSSSGESASANLCGVRDTDNLCELLKADRLWVEKSENAQFEYGAFTLGVSHEYFSEIVFDALS